MADTLLIHFNPAQADTATWSLVNGSGELTTMISRGSLADAAALAIKHKTVVLLDGASIHISSVNLPVKNHQKLLRAIPYALEEQIADDVEDLHFVAGKKQQNGDTPVAAIKHGTLKSIISSFNQAGIEPVAIIPDALCLAASPKQWAILVKEGQANIQFDSCNGGEFDIEYLPALLSSYLRKKSQVKPEKIILFLADDTTDTTIESAIRESLTDDIELLTVSYNTHPLVVFCGQYTNALSLNLLQDSYKPRSKGNAEWRRWRLAASLAALLLVLHLGNAGSQYHTLQQENDKLRVQIEQIYKSTFPESKKVVNARVQMEQKLNELKNAGTSNDNAGIITLLSDSADALSSEKDITLRAINYRNNKIDLELTSASLGAIESLNKKLNRLNIKSEIISSSSEKTWLRAAYASRGQVHEATTSRTKHLVC